jgi:hypothetical protein
MLVEPLQARQRVDLGLELELDGVEPLREVRAEEGDREEAETVKEDAERECSRRGRGAAGRMASDDQSGVEKRARSGAHHPAVAPQRQAAVQNDEEVEGDEGAVDAACAVDQHRRDAQVDQDLQIEL